MVKCVLLICVLCMSEGAATFDLLASGNVWMANGVWSLILKGSRAKLLLNRIKNTTLFFSLAFIVTNNSYTVAASSMLTASLM